MNEDIAYEIVKRARPDLYKDICAFASTFGKGDDEIDVTTRYQVERYCMFLAMMKVQP